MSVVEENDARGQRDASIVLVVELTVVDDRYGAISLNIG